MADANRADDAAAYAARLLKKASELEEKVAKLRAKATVWQAEDPTFFPPAGAVSLSGDEDNQLYDPAKDPSLEKEELEPIPFEDMIINLFGKAEPRIEIARSFSFKKNLGNYESADFFCSAKKECKPEDAEATSQALYDFCRKQVQKDIAAFLPKAEPPVADPTKPEFYGPRTN